VRSTDLSKKNIFSEDPSENWSQEKFTMPNLSKGCIIEWKYTLSSPYKAIDMVEVQFKIPVKKLYTSIAIPEYFSYAVKHKGYLQIETRKEIQNRSINIVNTYKEGATESYRGHTRSTTNTVNYKVRTTIIEMENIPAIIEEPYINNIDNYRATISYELSSVQWPGQLPEYFSKTWDDVAKTILRNPNFGGELKKTGHLKDDVALMQAEFKTPLEKIYGALAYVKSKIKWNDYFGKYPQKGLRKAYKEGTGNIGDINLTLVAVLRELGLNANPVLVSTRDNGIAVFPTLSGFNYVIAAVDTNQGIVLLDASDKFSLPNVLPLRVVNWDGALLRDDNTVQFVNLESTTVAIEETILSYKIDEEGFVEGLNRVKYKNYAALRYRNKFGNVSEESLISNTEDHNDAIEILNFRVSNLDKIEKPLAEMYKFEKEDAAEIIGDRIYLTPMLFNATTENPFKIDKRGYPVDFGTPWQYRSSTIIQIPESYSVESLPENIVIEGPDNLGKFIYSIKKQGQKITLSSVIEINRSVISANYYPELKELFKVMVQKQTEKIVLVRE